MTNANSFIIIKQDAVKRNLTNKILDKFLKDHVIVMAQLKQLTVQEARDLYVVHSEKLFYNDLVTFMVDGPSMILLLCNKSLSNSDAILLVRDMTQQIREEFGTSVRENCIHASDSVEAMIRESALFFFQYNDSFFNIMTPA